MVASSLTVGLGGSVGLEAPIVLTGSSIGSNIGRILKLNYKTVVLLMGCGAAGAIAGIFKAPIAALIFAFEVLMLDLTTWSIVPLLISSVTAAIVSYFLLGEEVVFSFTISEPFVMANLPFYLLLGIFTGLVSLYFTRMNNWVEGSMGKIKNRLVRTLTGGLLLCVLIFLMPQLFGEGYITLKTLLTGQSGALFDGTLFEGMIGNNCLFHRDLLPDADHLQGDCHGADHRERRRGRHLCPCPFCGRHGRGHPFQSGEPVQGRPVSRKTTLPWWAWPG